MSTLSLLALTGLLGANPHYEVNLSAFMLGNLLPEPPRYAHIELAVDSERLGHWGLELITWEYKAPLGVSYGADFGKPHTQYPGKIRDVGLGLTYQHWLWQGWFVKGHALPSWQRYFDQQNKVVDQGFQLFMAARTGYRWQWGGWFVEPSIAATAWPLRSKAPADFAAKDKDWPSYFLFEPGLNIGYRF